MKIIPQSFEPVIDTGDHVANIATAARLCYKSEGKALENETPFVNGLVKGRHNSTLEMSILHLRIYVDIRTDHDTLLKAKYLVIDKTINGYLLCTGSIRAWREFVQKHAGTGLAASISEFLFRTIPHVFTDDLISGTATHMIEKFDPNTLPPGMAKRHIHQGIKFITNRAVTHEMVRHRPCGFLQESQRYCKYMGEVTFIDPKPFFAKGTVYYNIWKAACEKAESEYIFLLNQGCSAQAARTILPNSCKTEIIVYCSLKQWEHILAMRDSKDAEPSMREAIEPVRDWFIETYPQHFCASVDEQGKHHWKRSVG